ncbi:uncharacterized protein LOC105846376 isoform X4 [Hydra vulgaris]|uniref:Uncharacterized protein LOC105846376 isoform X4 n=1 Tax=Hydra vulgaris TaxID=6087 RepID=A0ABM4CXY4_HYDVU
MNKKYSENILFNFSEISDSAYTESFLEQCSSKSFEKQEFCPSTSNKEQLEQSSSKSLSSSTCNEDLLKQCSSKSLTEEFWFSTLNKSNLEQCSNDIFRQEFPIPLSTEDSNENYGKMFLLTPIVS